MIPLAFKYCAKLFKEGILDYKNTKPSANNEVKKASPNSKYEKEDVKRLGFIVGTSIIIYVGMQVIISAILTISKDALLSAFNSTDKEMISQILAQLLSILPAYLFIRIYTEKKDYSIKKALLYVSKPQMILITVAIIYLLQIVLSLVIYPLFGIDYDVLNTLDLTNIGNPLSKFLVILALAIVPAILEELLFRKAFVDLFRPYGAKFAVIFSAILFGLLHMNLSQCVFAFIMGIIFGSIYIYTNDIKITMLVHFINNGIASLAIIFSDVKFKIPGLDMDLGVEYIISLALSFLILIGIILGIRFMIKLSKERKWNRLPVAQKGILSPGSAKYLFCDYIFDFSIILLLVLSLLTENILQAIGWCNLTL